MAVLKTFWCIILSPFDRILLDRFRKGIENSLPRAFKLWYDSRQVVPMSNHFIVSTIIFKTTKGCWSNF